MEHKHLTKNIYHFYRHDCCWPYAVSFFLTLGIYWVDFFFVRGAVHWASLSAYGILLAYYLYNIRHYVQGRLTAGNNRFFISFLSAKVFIWGFILILLCLTG